MKKSGKEKKRIKICLAGATGWVGRALVPAILDADDLKLTAAVARTEEGKSLGDMLGINDLGVILCSSVKEALKEDCDVLVDYTSPLIVKENVMTAIKRKINVVIGTSGLTDSDYEEIHKAAVINGVGVLAAGNFAITAVLLQKFAEIAAKYIPQWEIFDYASDDKPDAPSGTSRELASRLSGIKKPKIRIPAEKTVGIKESRGANLHGMQVHSVRLPGYISSAEVIFGLDDMRLTIRHDAGNSAVPYVHGTLMAVRKVVSFMGLKRGLDTIIGS